MFPKYGQKLNNAAVTKNPHLNLMHMFCTMYDEDEVSTDFNSFIDEEQDTSILLP